MLWHGKFFQNVSCDSRLLKDQKLTAIPLDPCEPAHTHIGVGTVPAVFGESGKVLSEEDMRLLGLLDEHAREVVQMLFTDPEIELQLSCRGSNAFGQSKRVKTAPSSSTCLSIIIYGAFHLFEDVGAFLQSSGMYLQDPVGCDRDVTYRNPHRLSGLDPDAPTTLQNDTLPVPYSPGIHSNPVELLARFESGDSLLETEGPSSLVTPLRKSANPCETRRNENTDSAAGIKSRRCPSC